MSGYHTGIYVAATGHVLAAFSSVGNPKGEFEESEKAALLQEGVAVRFIAPSPQTFPFLLAFEGKIFQFEFPTSLFSSSLVAPIVYSLDVHPAWLSIDSDTAFLSGMPPSGSSGLSSVTVRATDQNGAFEQAAFTVRVHSPPPFKTPDAITFLVPHDSLELASAESSDDIVRRPRSYGFADEKFKPLPEPIDRIGLSYQLDSNTLRVRLQSKAPLDVPLWAMLRATTTSIEQINSGAIPKDSLEGTIGFTLDPAVEYEVLLMVAGYDPFFAAIKVGTVTNWPDAV